MSTTRNNYTLIRYTYDSVVLTDRVLVEPEHEVKVLELVDDILSRHPEAVVETVNVYMHDEVYVDPTLTEVTEGE